MSSEDQNRVSVAPPKGHVSNKNFIRKKIVYNFAKLVYTERFFKKRSVIVFEEKKLLKKTFKQNFISKSTSIHSTLKGNLNPRLDWLKVLFACVLPVFLYFSVFLNVTLSSSHPQF